MAKCVKKSKLENRLEIVVRDRGKLLRAGREED